MTTKFGSESPIYLADSESEPRTWFREQEGVCNEEGDYFEAGTKVTIKGDPNEEIFTVDSVIFPTKEQETELGPVWMKQNVRCKLSSGNNAHPSNLKEVRV